MTKLQYILKSLVFASVTFAAAACGTVFDAEQDCSTKVKFEFRKHRQALQAVNGNPADVFASTAAFDKGDYEVVYTDANGSMKFEDNSLTDDSQLEYRAHTTSLLTAETEYNGQLVEAGALVAHLSTARLMDAHKNDARLEVRNKDGVTVFSIPFIKYVLEMQTFTADGQYYLDCEDTYNCSFYLSGSGELWAPALIIINNWVRVPDQTDVLGR